MNEVKILDINYEFGKRIFYLRNEKKLSQEELAFRCGINKNYLSDIERGQRNPTLKIIQKIAVGLDIELYELFIGISKNSYFLKHNS